VGALDRPPQSNGGEIFAPHGGVTCIAVTICNWLGFVLTKFEGKFMSACGMCS